MTITDRFWAKVNKDGPVPLNAPHLGPCWEWTSSKNPDGYGEFWLDGKSRKAYRVSYEFEHGAAHNGLHLDHQCRHPSCVRPSHLRQVTHKQNHEHRDMRTDNTSGYRGVTFDKVAGKWRVQVGHGGRKYSGGYFADIHEAGLAARSLRNCLFTHNDLDRLEKAS